MKVHFNTCLCVAAGTSGRLYSRLNHGIFVSAWSHTIVGNGSLLLLGIFTWSLRVPYIS